MTGVPVIIDQHADSQVIGGRLLDAADPTHDVPPPSCLVCHSTDARRLHRVNLTPPDMAAAGLPAGDPPIVCLRHYEAALRRVGQPSATGHQGRCIACKGTDPGYFGVVAVWPLLSGIPTTQPIYRACARHLAEAIAALASERENPA